MPLYKFTVYRQVKVTHFVESDNPEIIKEWILNDNNPNELETGPGHNREDTVEITKMEELSSNVII